MKKGFSFWIVLVILLLVIASFFFFEYKISGNAALATKGQSGEIKKECIAAVDEMSFDIGAAFSKQATLTRQSCLSSFNGQKSNVMKNICLNTNYIDNVEVYWGYEKINEVALECPESLLDENSDTAIIYEGEYYTVVSDDFETGKSHTFPALKLKDGSSLEIVTLEKNNFVSEFKPATNIKLRGKKSGSTLTLDTIDERSIRKI